MTFLAIEGDPEFFKPAPFSIRGMDMAGMEMIFRMIRFADEKHKGQKRKGSGLDYVSHPLCGAFLLTTFKKSKHIAELICAFIGHDLFEDTDTTFEEISRMFTPLVATLMWEMTSDPHEVKRLGKNEYFKVKLPGLSNYALILKLVDRLYNVLDRPKMKYVKDTIELVEYLPKKRKLTKTHKAIITAILERCNALVAEVA